MTTAAKLKLFLAAVSVGAAGAAAFYAYETRPESSPYTRGATLADAAGCYACHGTSFDDPRANFRLRDDGAWRDADIAPIWEEAHSPESLRTWITHGVPASKRDSHTQLLLQMPAYGDDGHLTEDEIEDVVTWAMIVGLRGFQGLDNREEDLPELTRDDVAELDDDEIVVFGDRLARQSGCYQCHGELGQGGPGNLAALKGYIPGFQGDDFRQLTADGDPAEIRHWIEHGRGQAIESGLLGPIARRFFERQAIPMPAYGEVLSAAEIDLLVAYVAWLNDTGPLDADDVEDLAESIDDLL